MNLHHVTSIIIIHECNHYMTSELETHIQGPFLSKSLKFPSSEIRSQNSPLKFPLGSSNLVQNSLHNRNSRVTAQ